MQFVMLKIKVGVLPKQVLGHIFGVHYGVRSAPAKGVAFESCQHLETLKGMPVTSIVTLTVAFIRNEENVR